MRSPKPAVLAVLLAVLLFWSLVPPAGAQSGTLTVSSDYELFGTTSLNGGGHVTWTLTGDVARQLRTDLVRLFDEYPKIPRDFVFGGDPTNGNHDGRLQAAEGLAYTDRLENVLEGAYPAGYRGGTQIGYFLLDRADLLDKDPVSGFNRSTTGIVDSTANSTETLQIRFLFNGATNAADLSMPLATETFAQALFHVFSIEADQAGAWPFPSSAVAAPGWHVVYVDGHTALWPGNTSACTATGVPTCPTWRYDNGTHADTQAVLDSSLGTAGAWLDLRFASSAWLTFTYSGRVADANDAVRVQVATEALNQTWITLPNGRLSVNNNTASGTWDSASLNLSSYLGERVLLRLNFTSDAAGSDTGFFLGNVSIHAPATYTGTVLESDAHYLIGTLSFSNFNVPSGNPTLVRTPAGEVLWYSSGFDTANPPPDTVRYAAFDVMENPQVLFAVMCIAAYVISRMQEVAYDGYRKAHPRVYRPAVHPVRWLHWAGRISIVVLVLFYFLPTAFFAIGLRVYFNGPGYFFLALGLALSLGFGTRAWYQQLLEEAPPPSVAEPGDAEGAVPQENEEPAAAPKTIAHCTHCLRSVHEGERTYTCSCGAVYHLACASGLMRCSSCRKPIAGLEKVGEKRSVSMRCSSCGEVQTVPEGADPRTLTCASCGGSLRSLDAGKRYLLVASNAAIAFHWLQDLSKGGKPSLVLTTASPDRLRLEFGLKGVQFAQVASQGAGTIDPKKLESAGLRAILPLAREGKGGVLLYDGLDQMIAAATLGEVVRFLRKANDMAFVHQVTVIGRLGPGILAETEVERLAAEFDELLDLSARL